MRSETYPVMPVDAATSAAENVIANGYISWYPRVVVTLAEEVKRLRALCDSNGIRHQPTPCAVLTAAEALGYSNEPLQSDASESARVAWHRGRQRKRDEVTADYATRPAADSTTLGGAA